MKYQRIDTKNYQEIMNQYHIGSLLAKVLVANNYSKEEILSFFNPIENFDIKHQSLEMIKQYFLEFKEKKQKVFIYGDYDCDGLCSTTILVKILNNLQISNGYYIPNRFKEGYGLNLDILKQAYQKGYSALICVDNGVSCLEQLQWAKDNGMKVIVIDHHQISQEVNSDILLHPSFLEEPYSYLCATGLVYILAEYLNIVDEQTKVLSMVATIADMMELKGINIKIINDGINIFNNKPDKHLISLSAELTLPINEDDIGFKITPKINAVGRLSDKANPNNVVRFFLSNNDLEINRLALGINSINDLRKELSNKQTELVINNINKEDDFIVYYSKDVHEGLCGLIANKITNLYNKPCIIFSLCDGLLKGSGRGIEGLDLYELLLGFKDYTETFGGHTLACGISMKLEQFDHFKQYIKENYQPIESIKEYLFLDKNDLTISNIKELYQYRPFGQNRKLPLMGIYLDNYFSYNQLKNDHQLKWQLNDNFSVLSFSNNLGYINYLNKRNLLAIGKLGQNIFNNKVSYNIITEYIIDDKY